MWDMRKNQNAALEERAAPGTVAEMLRTADEPNGVRDSRAVVNEGWTVENFERKTEWKDRHLQ